MLLKNSNYYFLNMSLIFRTLINHLIFYPTPKNINYVWSFGSLAGLFFFIQILTGVFLAMHYVPNIDLAFESVEHIMRDVKAGWFIRYLHANGASLVFAFIYLHLAKGLYFRSYTGSRLFLWISGVVIFLLMMGTAFLGYVLPWGQMSYWGATVITNLISAIPYVGESVAYWIWGGFSVGNPTLNRFFSFHYLLPLLILGIIFLHLCLLHEFGSTNPIGVSSSRDLVFFWPYFGIKDTFIFFFVFALYVIILYYYPNMLGHPDNYIPANPLVTPAHIVPEWYLLPFYAILRAIPDKLFGVIGMLAAIIILAFLPIISTNVSIKSTRFLPVKQIVFWTLLFIFIFLGYIGGNPADEPFILAGRIAACLYFLLLTYLEIFKIKLK